MLNKIYFLLLYLIMKCQTFQFKSPYVSVSPSTINTLGQYQIIVQRQFTQQVTNTAWNTTAVPAGSSIVAIFPPQFVLSGNQVCQFIVIGSDMPTFTCNIYTSNNTISFDGAITTNQFISDVTMSIANVLNPFPAITTSPFLVTIGLDYSATDPFAAVSLTPALFTTTILSFNPATVNTTSNMIINLTTTNKLPVGSSIVVKFPYNLQWGEDVSSSHQLQLNSSMVCSSLSSAVSAGVQCSGLPSTQEVTITSISTGELPASSLIIFSINSLFSPPTQNPIDNITITSLVTNSNGSYLIDKSSATFSGLTARTLADLSILPTTTTKTINTNIGLKVSFTILDTITNVDYFQVAFPAGTVITYTTSLSTFSLLSNVTYNSTTGVLAFYQSTISATRTAGTSAYITFLTYKTPNSTKPTSPIIFRVMKNGYAKMRGSSIFTADPKAYTFNVSTNDTNINARGSYQINFGLADPLDPSGHIILTLPPELVQDAGGISVVISSNSSVINTQPTVVKINSTSYSITNLNKTSSALLVPAQSLTLIVSGVAQPDASRVISNFYFSIYLNTENYLTAYGTQNNSITIITGAITAVAPSTSTMVTYSLANLSIVANYQNSVPVGGYLYLTIPSDISLPSTLVCSLQSNSTIYSTTCTKQSSVIIATVTTLIPAGSQLTVKVMGIITPISTMPTVTFAVITKNADNLTIDTSTSLIQVAMGQPTQLSNLEISRSSSVNYQLTQFTIVASTLQTLYSYMNNFIYFQFPTEVTVTTLSIGLMNQFNATTNPTYNTVSLSPLKISILLPPNTTSLTGYSFIFNGLMNPPSLKPTTLGLLATVGFNLTTNSSISTYVYASTTSNTIQNTIVADFTSIGYAFSKSILFSETNLSINLGLVAAAKIGMLQLQLDTSIKFKDNTSLSICSSPQMSMICTVTSSSPSIIQITPIFPSTSFVVSNSSLSLTVGLITTPTFYSSSYPASILTTFDTSNYPISRNITYLKLVPMCPMPCWSCVSNQSSQCTSCYLLSHDITNLLYYVQTTNQSYGQCLSSCPSGYYINSSNIYQCLPCNSNCVQCQTTSVNCTVCSATTYLYTVNSTCMIQCPNGTYSAISSPTNLCVACPISCQICSSLTVCSKCQSGYFLYTNFCYTSCPVNYTIANLTTRVCDPCSISCLTCLTLPTYCSSCPNSLVLTNGTCLSTCPSISMIPINGTCTLCSSPCQTCSVALGNCTSCYTNSSSPFLYNNTCISTCPDTYYGAISTAFNCLSCSSLNIGCLNCSSNGQYCLSCDLGYLYFNNSLCLNYTPNGFANISGVAVPCSSGCSTCIGTTTNCTACLSPLLFYSNSCVQTCPNFTTVVNGSCAACLSPCSQCSGTTNYCLSCVNSFFLNSYHQCVNGTGCQNYTYPNSTTGTCMQCNSPCLQCTTSIACNSCIQGFYFYSITTLCLDMCPSGWVGVVDLCVPCTSPCKYCEINPQHCTSCITNYYLNTFTHQCLLQCPQQVTISNPITMTCDLCNATCATCQNQTTICTSCITGAYLLGTQCFTQCPSGYYGQITSNTCQSCNPLCLTCSTGSTQCTSCYTPQYLFNSTCVSTCPPTYGIRDSNGNCMLCSIRLQNCLTCTSSGSCINCQSPSVLLNGQCYTDCPTGYILNSTTNLCVTTDQNVEQELNNSLSSSSVFPMPFTCIGFSIFIAFLMSKLQNKNTYLIGSGYGLLGILETVSLAYLILKYANYNQSLQASPSAAPLANEFPLLAIGLIIIYSLNLIGFVAQTPILCSDTKFEGWLKSGVHKFIFIVVTLLSLLVNYKIKLFLFTKLFGFTSTRSQLESVQKFRSFNILSFLGVSHEIFVIYISIVMLSKLPTTILNNQMFLIFIDTLVITFVTIIFSILANKKDDDFFTQLADNGYVLNKKVMVQGDDICQQPLEPKYLRGDENKQGKVNQMDSFQKMISQEHQQVDIYEDQEISLSISENKSELDRRQKVQKKKEKISQMSDNQSNSDKNKTRLKIKDKNRLHFSNDQTSNPINKELLNAGQKDLQLNQAVRQSVIFDRQKDYDQQQVISKNHTVLIESPSKKQQKKEHDLSSKQKSKNSDKKQNLNLFFNENQQNVSTLQQITLQQNQNKKEVKEQKLQNNHQSNQLIKENDQNLIQEQEKEKEKEKEKEEKKREEKRKENEAKIFREQKILSKEDLQNEQIKNRIAVKLKQLQGLKRQNSQKELRRSRQKQKEREKQSINNSIILKNGIKQKQASKYKYSESKSYNNFFERDQKQIQATPENNLAQSIRQNRSGNEQIQKNLTEQKQHQKIQQQIDMRNSMGLNKKQPQNLQEFQDKSQLGNLKNKAKNKSNNSNTNDQILQLNSSQNSCNNIRDEKQIQNSEAFGQRIQGTKNNKLNDKQEKKNKVGQKEKPKIHIENMYDSVVKMQQDEPSISDNKRQGEHKEREINKNERQIYEIDENMSQEQDYQKKNKYRKGVEIGIGESLENILENSQTKDKDKQKSRYQNMFQLQNDQRDLQDSGLEDSQPYMDEQINHRPLRSSFATERRSVDIPQTQLNSDKHPLIGILRSGQQGLIRHQIPKMNEESERPSNREEESKTKMQKYGGNGSGEQQTIRKQQDRPPLQRPITNQRNRIYAAGLRQFEDLSNAQKSSLQHHLNENSKQSLEFQSRNMTQKQKKRNHSLYEVKLNKLESKESKDNSSDNTEDILMRPGFSNQNSSIEDINFIKPKYTQTMVIENLNEVPEKPKVGMTSRINYNHRISTSQQRGGRNRIDANLTAGEHMFTKKSSVEYQHDDQEDQLDHFYGKERESKKRKSPKRSKSKQRMHSKQSVKRMRQIQKVYLQRLQPPKRKN